MTGQRAFITWSSFQAMLKQQFLLLTRYPVNLVTRFVLVLMTVLVITLMLTLFVPPEQEDRLKSITLSGFIVYIFLSHTIWAVGMSISTEKTEGSLTGFYLTPASRLLTLLARFMVVVAWTSLAGLIGLVLVQAVSGPVEVQRPWLALGILLLTISGLMGLGFATAGLALRFGESIELLANLVEFTLLGLCGMFFPFAVLPAQLQWVARLIPLSYAVDAFRAAFTGAPQPELLSLQAELVIVLIIGLLSPAVGYGFYRLNETKVRQQGEL